MILLKNVFLFVSSHHEIGAVVPNRSAARATISPRELNSQLAQTAQTIRYDGQAKLETSVPDFRSSLELSKERRAATPGRRRSLPTLPTASTGGRRPAKYCASNARRDAATVGPIPTMPSSMLGRSKAIQSSLRKDNRGRRTADGLPG